MKVNRSTVWILFVGAIILLLAPVSVWAAPPISLAGYWNFEMDPTDAGEQQQWFNRNLRGGISLPGILQHPYQGNAISIQTPWVLTQYDRFWYLRDDYKNYLEPGKVVVPFLSQPPRHYLGAAWYQRDRKSVV